MANSLLTIDATVTKKLYHRPKWLQPIMRIVNTIGKPIIIIFICSLLALLSYVMGYLLVALGFGFCLAALAVSGILKSVLKRERPASQYVKHMGIKSFSFPSGHALGTLVLYGYMAFLVGFFTPFLLIPAVILFTLLILLTGMARVYVGAHYVSDVLGGWLLGGLALFIIIEVLF